MAKVRQHLQAIDRFPQTMEGREGLLCLDRNERVDPFSPDVWQQILGQLRPEMMCHYPDGTGLVRALAKQEAVETNQVYLTNGSDAALRMLFQSFLRPKSHVVTARPSYAMTAIYGEIFEGQVEEISYREDRTLDVAEICARVWRLEPGLVVLANPDQPTGATLSNDDLRRVAVAVDEVGGLLIVDEAYYPFHPSTAVDLVLEGLPVAVIRSGSKWMGIPGLRLGYLVAPSDIVDGVQKIRGAHEVNSLAIQVGTYLTRHSEIAANYAAELEEGRVLLTELGGELGYQCPPCPANFQLLELDSSEQAQALAKALEAQGILVKGGFGEPSLARCVRVTLAGRQSIAKLTNGIREVWSEISS